MLPSDFEDSEEFRSNIEDSDEFGSDNENVERFNDEGANDESSGDEADYENLADWGDTIEGAERERDISEYEPFYLSSRRRLAEGVTMFLDAYDRAVSSE